MKKILVPTDFSPNAKNALEYAAEMANLFESNIALYHTYRVYTTTGSFVSHRDLIFKENKKELNSCIASAKGLLNDESSIEGKVIEGDLRDVVSSVADKKNYDLVIMGTKGASGLKEVFLGSNTVSLIRKTKTPVLAIPSGYQYRPIKKIVLAVDNKEFQNADMFRVLKDLCKKYDAQLHLFHVTNEDAEEGIDPGLSFILEDLENVTVTYEFEGKALDSIHEYVKENDADMLCMIQHDKGFLQSLFQGSRTIKEAYHPTVPFLILKE